MIKLWEMLAVFICLVPMLYAAKSAADIYYEDLTGPNSDDIEECPECHLSKEKEGLNENTKYLLFMNLQEKLEKVTHNKLNIFDLLSLLSLHALKQSGEDNIGILVKSKQGYGNFDDNGPKYRIDDDNKKIRSKREDKINNNTTEINIPSVGTDKNSQYTNNGNIKTDLKPILSSNRDNDAQSDIIANTDSFKVTSVDNSNQATVTPNTTEQNSIQNRIQPSVAEANDELVKVLQRQEESEKSRINNNAPPIDVSFRRSVSNPGDSGHVIKALSDPKPDLTGSVKVTRRDNNENRFLNKESATLEIVNETPGVIDVRKPLVEAIEANNEKTFIDKHNNEISFANELSPITNANSGLSSKHHRLDNSRTSTTLDQSEVKIPLSSHQLNNLQHVLNEKFGVNSHGSHSVANFHLDKSQSDDKPIVVIVYNCSCNKHDSGASNGLKTTQNEYKHTDFGLVEENTAISLEPHVTILEKSNNSASHKAFNTRRMMHDVQIVENNNIQNIYTNTHVLKSMSSEGDKSATISSLILDNDKENIKIREDTRSNSMIENEMLAKCRSLLALQKDSEVDYSISKRKSDDASDRVVSNEKEVPSEPVVSYKAKAENSLDNADNSLNVHQIKSDEPVRVKMLPNNENNYDEFKIPPTIKKDGLESVKDVIQNEDKTIFIDKNQNLEPSNVILKKIVSNTQNEKSIDENIATSLRRKKRNVNRKIKALKDKISRKRRSIMDSVNDALKTVLRLPTNNINAVLDAVIGPQPDLDDNVEEEWAVSARKLKTPG